MNSLENHFWAKIQTWELKFHLDNRACKSSSALFLPTLVESFGLIYLEAMKYGCPIITSDRDFSRWICGDLAMYFDPMDAISIANTIENFISNPTEAQHKKHIKNRLKAYGMD